MIKVTGEKMRLITFSFGNREMENCFKKLSKTAF
jgi:hypothetical protein